MLCVKNSSSQIAKIFEDFLKGTGCFGINFGKGKERN